MMMFVTHDSIGFGGAGLVRCAHFKKSDNFYNALL
jgi:hypothetical protein